MNAKLNPEAKMQGAKHRGIQLRMAYLNKIDTIDTLSLSKATDSELRVEIDGKPGYRFFVHPEGYDHFRSLHIDPSIHYVAPANSEYIATPSSSYRSLAFRRVSFNGNGEIIPAKNSIPFVIKLSVGGSILGSDRWLSINEIDRSVHCQRAFDGMDKTSFMKDQAGKWKR